MAIYKNHNGAFLGCASTASPCICERMELGLSSWDAWGLLSISTGCTICLFLIFSSQGFTRNLVRMWNTNFQSSSLWPLFIHQFPGLKCSPDSWPGCLVTPDRHGVFKAPLKTPGPTAQAGRALAVALAQLRRFREGRGAGGCAAHQQKPPPARAQPPLGGEHIDEMNWAVVAEVSAACSLTAPGELPVPFAKPSHLFF